MVSKADAVMFVAPEYNHGLSAVQKNAIDWLYSEWNAKVVAYVVYGWHAGVHTLAQLQEISTVVKWKPIDKVVASSLLVILPPTVVLLRQKRFGVRLSLPWTN